METVLFAVSKQVLTSIINDAVAEAMKTAYQPQQQVSDELLTIQQAANFLSLSVPTIYGLVSKAEIPNMKRGKRLYFSRTELTEWLKGGRRKTNTDIAADNDAFLAKR